MNDESAISALYRQLMDGWNQRNGAAMGALFVDDGELIGYDGSFVATRSGIQSLMELIFKDHVTPPYYTKVKGVRMLGPDGAILRAMAGMIPPGGTELEPKLNAWHTLVAVKQAGQWRISLFQNTPAQYHGRPELLQAMTEEIRAEL